MLKSLFKIFAQLLASRKLYLTKSLTYFDDKKLELAINLDYVRYRSLELCAHEIKSKSIGGNLAEVGVYQGSFAQKLNTLFPGKKLYLFDTFEGFDQKDVDIEKEKKFSMGEQDFSNTSVEVVMSKMLHPTQCIIKKGFFPDTAQGLEDQFCFVSLDADLYQPIIAGLEYFYPRLLPGGFIFVHDFNNAEYSGAKEAVYEFCQKYNVGFVPIPDSGGTAIISK